MYICECVVYVYIYVYVCLCVYIATLPFPLLIVGAAQPHSMVMGVLNTCHCMYKRCDTDCVIRSFGKVNPAAPSF